MNTARVTDILLVPGLSGAIAIGLVVDGQQIAWGHCEPASLHGVDAIATLRDTIGPALRGRSLASFRNLAAHLEVLRERVTITTSLPAGTEPGVTRRALLTGRFHPSPTPPQSRQEIVEQPLHPALQYGASLALLQAVALAQGRSPVELLADEYALDMANEPPPAWVSLGRPDTSSGLPPFPHWPPLAAFGYHTSAAVNESELGEGGVLLQRAVRQLREALGAWEQATDIIIGLHLQGALGRLLNNQPGQMLGALYGLHHAARPYPLWISDPVLLEEPAAQRAAMTKLKTLMHARRMNVQLVAAAHITSADSITAFAQEDAADAFLLDARQWGSLHHLITGVLACREVNRPVILAGDREALALAPALQPAMLALPVDELVPVYDELGRRLTWLALRAGRLQ